MLFVPINAESEAALDEKNAKTFEQQQAEIARFEELKQCYQCSVDAIKECDFKDAERILLNLYDTEIFGFRTFEGKQLQRAVMKLILSLPPHSRQLEVCLKALEVFPEETFYLQKLAQIMFQAGRFNEAADANELLYRSEPLNAAYLHDYVESLKRAGNFIKLDDLKTRLIKSGMMIIDDASFDWKADLTLREQFTSQMIVDDSAALPTLCLPMKEVNWTTYAHILNSMANGNFSAVFKKAHFERTDYAVLSGPCVIELASSTHSQSQTQTQNLLLSSVQEYLTSSMEDLGNVGESQSKRRSTARKRETKSSLPNKNELTPADFIKNVSHLFSVEESCVIDTLCSTEPTAIALIDKNNVSGTAPNDESSTSLGLFTSDSLVHLIESDNQSQKSIMCRIFELLRYFFVEGLGQAFPPALGQQIFSISRLFHKNVFSFDNLKDFFEVDFVKYCLGVAELTIELDPAASCCHEFSLLHGQSLNEPDFTRLNLLSAFFAVDKLSAFQAFSLKNPITTRFFKCLPHLVSQQSIQGLLGSFEQLCSLEEVELLLSEGASKDEIISKLGNNYSLKQVSGVNRLRLGRILLKTGIDLDSESCQIINSELFNSASLIDLQMFTEILMLLLGSFQLSTFNMLQLVCLFWNLFSRRHLLPASSFTCVSNCFVRVLNCTITTGFSLETYSFVLNWLAQEKCFGSQNALVPLSVFRVLAVKDDFPSQLVAFSIAFSLWRFSSIFSAHEAGTIEDWDRHPIGTKECQTLPITFDDLDLLCCLLWKLIEKVDNEKVETKLVISDASTVACIDWLKECLAALPQNSQYLRDFGHAFSLNGNQIRSHLACPLDLHAKGSLQKPKPFHVSRLQTLRILLNFRSDIIHAELQGRKKSFEVLKTLRSDLKMSLSMLHDDAEVWCLLGTCYYDALVHFLSSEAEFITAQQGKLKRTLKKAILCFQASLRLDRDNLDAWAKLSDLCDWALHYPSQLPTTPESLAWICSLGSRAVQFLLPRIAPRDLWQQLLRLELFFRRSGRESSSSRLLSLLRQAVIAACQSYCENVYESTALYSSLAKFYSRLGKSANEQLIATGLHSIAEHLPAAVKPAEAATPVLSLLAHLDALNGLDRKKIFHAHFMTSAQISWRLLNDSAKACGYLSSVFPYLKPNKRVAQSLCQVYQSDHDRPARFLSCTRRYLLRLFQFIAESDAFPDKLDLLATTLKKLHYVRKTILGFPELLLAATQAYFSVAEREILADTPNRPDIIEICHELLESLEEASVPVPPEFSEFLLKNETSSARLQAAMSFISRYLWKRKPSMQPESGLGLKTLSGRFGVGFVDVEWEDTELLAVPDQDVKLIGHDLPYILARIYYPTGQVGNDAKDYGTWLPSSHYFPGYGYFMRLPSLVSSGIGRLLAANVRLPAVEGASLLPIRTLGHEAFPVAFFSHGLGGIRTTYSTICCELASRGMIVVALEHRDGSASMTIDRDGRVFPYVTGPSGVTLPMVDYAFRSAQLRHRLNELKATLKFLKNLNEGAQASTVTGSAEWLKELKGRLLLERLCLVGHSFGGATCLAAAQQMLNVSCCVAFDPWMFPLPQPRLHVQRTDIDTLLVLNEKFSWPENDFALHQFTESMRETQLKKTRLGQVCLRGCGHMDQSDLASIVPARIIQMIRPNTSLPTTPHNILQVNVDLVAAHLSASYPLFHFDAAYSMTELEEHLRRDADETNCANSRINLARLLVKIEAFYNYS